MFNIKPTEEQRIEKAMSALMSEPHLLPLVPVLMLGTRRIDENCPTAYTDGINERYGRSFVAACSDAALRGVMLHEVGHKMFRHLITWQHLFKKNHRRVNMAADYVVNLWVKSLIDSGVDATMSWPSPAICLLDTKYTGMSVQQVYDLLQDDDASGGMDDHGWDSAQKMSADEVQELVEQIDQALRQGKLASNKVGDGNELDLGEMLAPKVNWRCALQEFLNTVSSGNDYASWSRPNRRFIDAQMYMPSGVSQQLGELVVGVDTSGSIDAEALREFLSEVVAICEQTKPQKLRLLYWDSKVQREEVYDSNTMQNLVASTKPAGGGGTDAASVTKHLRKNNVKPQAVVMFTDGYVGSWGNWDVPVLWCVVGSKVVPPVGRSVFIDASTWAS